LNAEKAEIILDAAEQIFKRYGYSKTTMDDIAREAMIGKGTIYYYFNTKEDIFLAIMSKVITEISKTIREKIETCKTFEGKVKALFTEPHEYFSQHHDLIIQVIGSESPAFLKKINEFKKSNLVMLRALLTEVFDFGVKSHVIRDEYIPFIDKIIEVIFKWVQFLGESIHKDIAAQTIDETIGDYIMFYEIFVRGLTKKQEV